MEQNQESYKNKIIAYIVSLLPDRLRSACNNYLMSYPDITELRLRLDGPISFSINGSNLITGMKCSRDDIQYCVDRLTDGNYFKNEELLRIGYVSLPYGIRAGVCGDVFVSSGVVKVLRYVNYINIRIPSVLLINCEKVLSYIQNTAFSTSILVFSPPCGGKTTLLRSIAYALGSSPYQKRVCVIDTNRELVLPSYVNTHICEYLSGYPKAYGINMATRYMNPEYIICDEIGLGSEIEAISETMRSGVPLIASLHADSFSAVKLKKNVSELLGNGAFDTLLRISRVGKGFDYELKKVSEI